MTSRKKSALLPPLPGGISKVEGLLDQPQVRESLKVFQRERRWIDDRHVEVCRIPAPTFFEEKRAGWMAEQLSELGWEVKLDRAGNVLAIWPGYAATTPLVAVSAHLDTVLAPLTPEEIRLDAKGVLRGPGVSDNGAGLAGLLALARAWAAAPLASQLPAAPLLVANVGEEGEGNLSGMKHLCRQSGLRSRIRSFLVLDGPSTDHVTFEALACRRFDITVSGPGGHSWSDHGTANAVHALARAITAFVDARMAKAPPARISWNFGVIEGGSTVNSIPATARAKVDLRSQDPALLDSLADELGALLEQALLQENQSAISGRVTARMKETGSRPGGKLPEESALREWVGAVDALLGIQALPDCASTDANIPLSLGLPALSIGAGGTGGGAHTPEEWFRADGRELGLRRAYLLLVLMLAGAAAGVP